MAVKFCWRHLYPEGQKREESKDPCSLFLLRALSEERAQSFPQNPWCKVQQLPYLFFRSPGQLERSIPIDPNKSYPTNQIHTELFRKQVYPTHLTIYANIQLKSCEQ